jgi:hypothetical protein
VKKPIKALDDNLKVTEIRIVVEGGSVEGGSLDNVRDKESLETGVAMTQGNTRTIHATEAIGKGVTYDLIGKLVMATSLTRKTIVEILKGIKPATFHLFKFNPEEFIIKASLIINDCKALAVIQCIKYEKLNDKFSTDIFTENMLRGKLGINAIESTKSLYDLVVLDSMGTEKNFAESLEYEDDVVVIPSCQTASTSIRQWASTIPTGLSPSGKEVSSTSILLQNPKAMTCRIVNSVALRKARLNVPVITSRPSATTTTSTTLPRTTSHYMIL